jgi:hypothetical protein
MVLSLGRGAESTTAAGPREYGSVPVASISPASNARRVDLHCLGPCRVSGRAEQWVGKNHRILGPGEMAFIPMGEIHGTYNPFNERLVFLAILSPSQAAEPGIVDVSTEEPWVSLRKSFPPVT